MPLKLLGKKSWHVYNADNIARVRRDEAAARAQEEDDERERRLVESELQAALVRGEQQPSEGAADDATEQAKWRDAASQVASTGAGADDAQPDVLPGLSRRPRKPRKRHGEDDTDFEMRLAREQQEQASAGGGGNRNLFKVDRSKKQKTHDRPLVDRDGHFDLLGQADVVAASSSGAGPLQSDVPPSSMRFADAAGPNGFGAWYAGDPTEASQMSRSSRSSQPTRRRRSPLPPPAGSVGADPLAAMKQGAAAMRALKKERQREDSERSRAMAALAAEQEGARETERRRRKEESRHHRRRGDGDDANPSADVDSLDGFTLDGPPRRPGGDEDDRGTERRHRHRGDRHGDDRKRRHGERERDKDGRHRLRERSKDRGRDRLEHRRRDAQSSHRHRSRSPKAHRSRSESRRTQDEGKS